MGEGAWMGKYGMQENEIRFDGFLTKTMGVKVVDGSIDLSGVSFIHLCRYAHPSIHPSQSRYNIKIYPCISLPNKFARSLIKR